ncbi:MAG: hypothetical protein MJB14_07590 [Spirochaetes bacterium]|nr:hypothetical protein [Spirochaetota bacterium]
MSWDVLFVKFPNNINSIDEIPGDYNPGSLCTRQYYEEMIFNLFPNIDENNDRSWMILEDDSYSIEFSAGTGEMLDSLMLHIRGDEKALKVIKNICDFTNWKAFDTTTGDLIDFDNNPDEGFSQWRNFKNKVIADNTPLKGIKISTKNKNGDNFDNK